MAIGFLDCDIACVAGWCESDVVVMGPAATKRSAIGVETIVRANKIDGQSNARYIEVGMRCEVVAGCCIDGFAPEGHGAWLTVCGRRHVPDIASIVKHTVSTIRRSIAAVAY